MKKIFIFLSLFVMLGVTLQAQNEKLRVAVFDPSSSGTSIDEGTKVAVRELISSTFVNTGKYTIVERSLLQQVMKEQAFSNTDVVDDSQATELGRLAGANKVVLSVVTLVGGRNMLSIKTIDVKTATVDQQKTKVVNSSELLDVVEPLALELLGEKGSTKTVVNSSSRVDIQDNTSTTNFSNNGDYALLHIYRPKNLVGALLGYDVHLGNEMICQVKNNWKTTIQIFNLGKNTIWAKTEAKTELPVNFLPGHEYYIRCGVKMGIITGRATFKLIDESTGKREFNSMKNEKSSLESNDKNISEVTYQPSEKPVSKREQKRIEAEEKAEKEQQTALTAANSNNMAHSVSDMILQEITKQEGKKVIKYTTDPERFDKIKKKEDILKYINTITSDVGGIPSENSDVIMFYCKKEQVKDKDEVVLLIFMDGHCIGIGTKIKGLLSKINNSQTAGVHNISIWNHEKELLNIPVNFDFKSGYIFEWNKDKIILTN